MSGESERVGCGAEAVQGGDGRELGLLPECAQNVYTSYEGMGESDAFPRVYSTRRRALLRAENEGQRVTQWTK